MNDSLFGNLNSELDGLKSKKSILFCAVCDARIPPGSIFCLECDPPLPPGVEPEETGISFEQALLRMCVLVALFVAVAFSKLDISFDPLSLGKPVKGEQEMLVENNPSQNKDFQTVHIVTVPLANIRSKPSMDGKIILTAEQGMSLTVIEVKENWSKIRVLEKIGWISNKLFKTEIIAP